MSTSGDRPLTLKQQAFVREYLVDLNATQAAVRAGYSERTASEIGYENLRKPRIESAIAQALEQRTERVQIDQDTVLAGLLKEAKGAKSDSARVQAWGLLGKHLAMFVDRSQLELKGFHDRVAAMSDAEVEELLAGGNDAIVAYLTAAGVHHAA